MLASRNAGAQGRPGAAGGERERRGVRQQGEGRTGRARGVGVRSHQGGELLQGRMGAPNSAAAARSCRDSPGGGRLARVRLGSARPPRGRCWRRRWRRALAAPRAPVEAPLVAPFCSGAARGAAACGRYPLVANSASAGVAFFGCPVHLRPLRRLRIGPKSEDFAGVGLHHFVLSREAAPALPFTVAQMYEVLSRSAWRSTAGLGHRLAEL